MSKRFARLLPLMVLGFFARVSARTNVTVVIMNWNRPRNVLYILRRVVEYASVSEVLVWHCKRETAFRFDHIKVRHASGVESNRRFGLSTRFRMCLQASNEQVLTVDDDVLPLEVAVNALLDAKAESASRLYGIHGRRAPACVYSTRRTGSGPVEIVLTRVMLTDRRLCGEYFRYSPLMEDVAAKGRPYWNGEDIFMSLVSRKVLGGRFPMALGELPHLDLPSYGAGISHLVGHAAYRSRFVRLAKERLGLDC